MRKRDIFILLGALCVAAALAIHIMTGAVLETASWGLSFPTPGKSPVGNATSAELSGFDACYLGDTQKQVIYLTFDSGYENGSTAKILDTLKKHDARLILSSDSHRADTIDFAFEEAKLILKDVGFTHVYTFLDGQFVKDPLY